MQAFDTRLQKLEDMFTDILTRFDAQASASHAETASIGVLNNPLASQPTPPSSYHTTGEAVLTDRADSVDEDNRLASTLMSLRRAKRQRHEQRTPNEPQIYSSRNHTRAMKRSKHCKNASQHRTYADAYGELRADESGQLRLTTPLLRGV